MHGQGSARQISRGEGWEGVMRRARCRAVVAAVAEAISTGVSVTACNHRPSECKYKSVVMYTDKLIVNASL